MDKSIITEVLSIGGAILIFTITYFVNKRKDRTKKNKKHEYKRVKDNLDYFKKLYFNFKYIDPENMDISLKKIKDLTLGELRDPLKTQIENTILSIEKKLGEDDLDDLLDKLYDKYGSYQKKYNDFEF